MGFYADLEAYRKAITPPETPAPPPTAHPWEWPKFKHSWEKYEWVAKMKAEFIGPPKPPPEKVVMHEIYGRIGTSDRQRAYLVKHGIKHVRKDGSYQ